MNCPTCGTDVPDPDYRSAAPATPLTQTRAYAKRLALGRRLRALGRYLWRLWPVVPFAMVVGFILGPIKTRATAARLAEISGERWVRERITRVEGVECFHCSLTNCLYGRNYCVATVVEGDALKRHELRCNATDCLWGN